jgi:multiple sugar transport system permease protein
MTMTDAVEAAVDAPAVDTRPLRRARRNRVLLQAGCILITLFMGLPIYLVTLAAFSTPTALDGFPQRFAPTAFSTRTMGEFLSATAIVPSFLNSITVGLLTVVLSLAVGAPAGYALARFLFRGRDVYQILLLLTRALPIVVLSIPLAQLFLAVPGLSDTILAVTLLHTALTLPTTVLVTASIFVTIPTDLEEAALVFGCAPITAFRAVVLPLALPGVAASSIFTFVLSWNEVLGASLLTTINRTLPAQLLTALGQSSLAFRFAGGFALTAPALVFIFFMRRYLLNMWGMTTR